MSANVHGKGRMQFQSAHAKLRLLAKVYMFVNINTS